ncbi:hypothetical protein AB0I28_37725 [Phytomonospora sp. NPDC050363]|uniref:hypothetical protein n=1 Tax=Phytomonospora sp. NPDC050363 TaxID=3155642 RepID=UPI0033E683E1
MTLLLVLLVLCGPVAAFLLVRWGVRGLRRDRRPGRTPRAQAAFLGAAAVMLYAWGLLHVTFAVLEAEDGGTGSYPLRPCRTADEPDRALRVDGYHVNFVPPGFVCESPDGDYTAPVVPGLVGLAALGTALAAGVAATAGAVQARGAATRQPVSGSPGRREP